MKSTPNMEVVQDETVDGRKAYQAPQLVELEIGRGTEAKAGVGGETTLNTLPS